jgi:CDGSH-type Zn-finger protein
MTRIVSHAATGPLAVPKTSAPGEALYVCRCGLSASPLGLCDGSHKATRDEQPGQVYLYERRDGQLVRVATHVATAATAVVPPLQTPGGAA